MARNIPNTTNAAAIPSSAATTDWVYVVLSGNITNSTTAPADVGLAFTPSPNKLYEINCWLIHNTSAATTGFQWSFVDGSSSTYSLQSINTPGGPASTVLTLGPMNTFGTAASNSVASQNMLAIGNAVVKSSANPSGTIKVQFQSEVAGGQSVTVLAGSFLRYRVIF